jgi:hypothetical protein
LLPLARSTHVQKRATSCIFAAKASRHATPNQCMIDPQHQNGADYRNDHAVNIKTGDARCAEEIE